MSEKGTVKIKLVGIEITAVLDASMTENAISFKTLYELKPFPKLQHCENNMVWTASGPNKIMTEFCPEVLVGHQVGYVNFLVFHVNGHSAIFGSTFMKEHILMGSAQTKPQRVEDYCESSEATEIVERFQQVEKVGLMITALLRGSVGIYGTMSRHVKKMIPVIRGMASKTWIFQVVNVG